LEKQQIEEVYDEISKVVKEIDITLVIIQKPYGQKP